VYDYVFNVYQEFNPDKINSIDEAMGKYYGNWDVLINRLQEKYGVDPSMNPINSLEDDGDQGGSQQQQQQSQFSGNRPNNPFQKPSNSFGRKNIFNSGGNTMGGGGNSSSKAFGRSGGFSQRSSGGGGPTNPFSKKSGFSNNFQSNRTSSSSNFSNFR